MDTVPVFDLPSADAEKLREYIPAAAKKRTCATIGFTTVSSVLSFSYGGRTLAECAALCVSFECALRSMALYKGPAHARQMQSAGFTNLCVVTMSRNPAAKQTLLSRVVNKTAPNTFVQWRAGKG